MRIKKSDVFISLSIYPAHWEECLETARQMGYRYIDFNGLIFPTFKGQEPLKENSICEREDLIDEIKLEKSTVKKIMDRINDPQLASSNMEQLLELFKRENEKYKLKCIEYCDFDHKLSEEGKKQVEEQCKLLDEGLVNIAMQIAERMTDVKKYQYEVNRGDCYS